MNTQLIFVFITMFLITAFIMLIVTKQKGASLLFAIFNAIIWVLLINIIDATPTLGDTKQWQHNNNSSSNQPTSLRI